MIDLSFVIADGGAGRWLGNKPCMGGVVTLNFLIPQMTTMSDTSSPLRRALYERSTPVSSLSSRWALLAGVALACLCGSACATIGHTVEDTVALAETTQRATNERTRSEIETSRGALQEGFVALDAQVASLYDPPDKPLPGGPPPVEPWPLPVHP